MTQTRSLRLNEIPRYRAIQGQLIDAQPDGEWVRYADLEVALRSTESKCLPDNPPCCIHFGEEGHWDGCCQHGIKQSKDSASDKVRRVRAEALRLCEAANAIGADGRGIDAFRLAQRDELRDYARHILDIVGVSDEGEKEQANRSEFIDARIVMLIAEARTFDHNHDEGQGPCFRCLAEKAYEAL